MAAGQHTEHAIRRQLRSRLLLLLVALSLAGGAVPPLAAQQTQRVVRGMDFVGNHSIDTYTLSTVIATTGSSFFATEWWIRWLGLGEKRYFDELEFRRDVVRLILYYRQAGFMRVVVDTSVRRTEKDVFVTFVVHEGEPVRVRRLDIAGVDSLLDVKALRRALPLEPGDPFNRLLLQVAADTVVAWLRNRGYPYAEVLRNFDAINDSLVADIDLEALPGPRMRVGEVVVQGTRRVNPATIRGIISTKPGDLVRVDKLTESQRVLYGTGLFQSVFVGLLDSTPPAAAGVGGDSVARVLIRVGEGQRRRVRIGAGYGSVDCLRVRSGLSSAGFLGGARVLDLSAEVSKLGVGYPTNAGLENNLCRYLQSDPTSDTLNYSLAATLFQPVIFSPQHTASVGVFAERRSQYQTYTRIQRGVNFVLTFDTRTQTPYSLGYTYSLGRTDADPAVFCSVFTVCNAADVAYLQTTRPFGAVTASIVHRTSNSLLDPTNGGVVGGNITYSSKALGSDSLYQFTRLDGEVAKYFPVGRRSVFAWRLRLGTILPVRVRLPGDTGQFVPPEQRFYAGGATTVRGYRANELGPKVYVTEDTTAYRVEGTDTIWTNVRASPTGGNSVLVLNAEYRFPLGSLPSSFRFAAFVDVGQVYASNTDFLTLKHLRVTPGIGLRFTTPLGPVRVDAGYNGYDPEPGPLLFESNGSLHQHTSSYQGQAPSGFFKRIILQFAIGQAY